MTPETKSSTETGTARFIAFLVDGALSQSSTKRSAVRLRPIPGLAAAIVIDDRLVWFDGWGWADLDAQRPMTPGTITDIASINKDHNQGGAAT